MFSGEYLKTTSYWTGIAFVLALTSNSAFSDFLKFDSDGISSFPKFRQSFRNDTMSWSAEWPTDSFLVMKSMRLELQCLVRRVTREYKVQQVKFCFEFKTGSECHTVDQTRATKIKGVSVRFTFDQTTGARASLPKSLPPFRLHCIAINKLSSIVSNRIFVLDLRPHYIDQKKTNNNYVVLHNPGGGSEFECMSKPIKNSLLSAIPSDWVLPEIQFDYKWYLCSGKTIRQCQKTAKPFPHEVWRTQIYVDGMLYVNFPESKDFERKDIEGKQLLCTVFEEPMYFYEKALKIKDDKADGEEKVKIRHPMGKAVDNPIYLLNASGYTLTLDCNYYHENAIVNQTWIHELNKTEGTESLKLGHQLQFTGPFASDVGGVYTCQIKTEGKAFSSSYLITVLNIPSTSSQVIDEDVYVAGNKVILPCSFDVPQQVTPGIAINGQDLDTINAVRFNDDERRIRGSLKGLKACPKPAITPLPPKKGLPLEYEMCTSRSQKTVQLYHITCIGNAPPFRVRKTTLVKIANPPNIIPDFHASETECYQCKFGCHIKSESWYLNNGLTPQYQWALTPKFDNKPEKFVIGGYTHEVDTRDLAGLYVIRCRVLLLSGLKMQIVYSSENDTRYHHFLNVTIEGTANGRNRRRGGNSISPGLQVAGVGMLLTLSIGLCICGEEVGKGTLAASGAAFPK